MHVRLDVDELLEAVRLWLYFLYHEIRNWNTVHMRRFNVHGGIFGYSKPWLVFSMWSDELLRVLLLIFLLLLIVLLVYVDVYIIVILFIVLSRANNYLVDRHPYNVALIQIHGRLVIVLAVRVLVRLDEADFAARVGVLDEAVHQWHNWLRCHTMGDCFVFLLLGLPLSNEVLARLLLGLITT